MEREYEKMFQLYREAGYTEEKDFPGEYRFFFNPTNYKRARVYYSQKGLEEAKARLEEEK